MACVDQPPPLGMDSAKIFTARGRLLSGHVGVQHEALHHRHNSFRLDPNWIPAHTQINEPVGHFPRARRSPPRRSGRGCCCTRPLVEQGRRVHGLVPRGGASVDDVPTSPFRPRTPGGTGGCARLLPQESLGREAGALVCSRTRKSSRLESKEHGVSPARVGDTYCG